jgi:hypothetical protein
MWVNVGATQFHLPFRPKLQVLRGQIGIVTPYFESMEERLAAVATQLKGTCFSWKRKGDRAIHRFI